MTLYLTHLIFLTLSLVILYVLRHESNISRYHNFISFFSFVISLSIFLKRDFLLGTKVQLIEVFDKVSITFYLDEIGIIFLLVSNFLWFLTSLYASRYLVLNDYKNQNIFYIFFLFAMLATNGIIYSENLFTIFIFYEILTLSTYPLVTLKKNEDTLKSGKKYLFILLGTSVIFLLPAIIVTYSITGSISFSEPVPFSGVSEIILITTMLLFIFGTAKSAVMPFHKWLPSAMVAPTPVSALLHAVAVVKSGVYILTKIFLLIYGASISSLTNVQVFVVVICFTIVASSVIAFRQDSIKLRLAYSTIGQLSYILLGVIILAPLSILAALLHFIFHAFGKIVLFLSAGIFATNFKVKNVSEMGGLATIAPLTCFSMTVGALIMIGLPPTVGFISKWYLLLGLSSSEEYLAISVIIISTLLNAGYYLPMIYKVYFNDATTANSKIREDIFLVTPVFLVTLIGIMMFFFSTPIVSFIQQIGYMQ